MAVNDKFIQSQIIAHRPKNVAKKFHPSQIHNSGIIRVLHLSHYGKFCNVTMAIFRGCTVPCSTRSPRWGTGYERDL